MKGNHSNSRLQNWHESFSLLDEEEEELSSDEETGRSRSQNTLNRSFVDFLFDDNANANAAASRHNNSFELDEAIPHPGVTEATLSDSFIARSYPTASVLRSVDSHSPRAKQKKKSPKSTPTQHTRQSPSASSSGNKSIEESSNSSLDLVQASQSPQPTPSSSSATQSHSDAAKSENIDNTKATTNRDNEPSIQGVQDMHQSMNLSQVFDSSLQKMEKYMAPPPTGPKDTKTEEQEQPKQQSTATTGTATSMPVNESKSSPPSKLNQSSEAVPPSAVQSSTSQAPTLVPLPKATTQTPLPAMPTSTQEPIDQRELWQQSMANDCLALEPPIPVAQEENAATRATDKDKDPLVLSDTVHERYIEEDSQVDDGKDDTSKLSDSYHDEGRDSASLAEEAENAVRKSLLYTILSAIGMVFLMKYIDKCCQCCQKGEDDDDQAAANLLGNNEGNAAGGGGNGNTNGNGTNNSVVQQMAIQASQNAAASAAQGSQAMASASGATGGGGMTTALVVAGALTTAAAVTAGVALAGGNTRGSNLLWMCDADKEPIRYTGQVVLYLEGVDDPSWFSVPNKQAQLEAIFVQEYNHLGCEETYQRVLESVLLDENSLEELVLADSTVVWRTNWTASVLCGGACSEFEPLFYIRAADSDPSLYPFVEPSPFFNATAASDIATSTPEDQRGGRQLTDGQRSLQDAAQDIVADQQAWFLLAFASNFSRALTTDLTYANSSTESVVVFDGYTLSPLDGSLVERIGTEHRGSPFSMLNVTQDILDTTGSSSSQRLPFDDSIPQCQSSPSQKEEIGYLHLMVENLDCQSILAEEDLLSQLENLFRAIFNRVGKGCEGVFQRVMQSASLINCTSMKANSAERGTIYFAEMDWSAVVLCDGCSSAEPVFLESFRRLVRRRLEEPAFLEEFASQFSLALETYFDSAYGGALDMIYAATLDTSDKQTVIQFTGQPLSGVPLIDSTQGNIFDQSPSAQDTFDSNASPTDESTNAAGEQDNLSNKPGESGSESSNIFDQSHTLSSQDNSTTAADQEQLCELEQGETMSYENGRVNLMVENVSPELLDLDEGGSRSNLEETFRQAYNGVSGMCEGDFKRVVHNARLISHSFGTRGDGADFVETSWKATVSCSGCNPKEPMFLGHQLSSSRALQMDVSSMLGKFSSEFSQALDTTIRAESGIGPDDLKRIAIFYIETLSSDGTEVMQSTGYHPQFYLNSGAGASRPRPSGDGSQPSVDLDTMDACMKNLVVVDSNSDNMLSETEYVWFVHRLIDQLDASVDMQEIQMRMPSFESLPSGLQEGFNTFSQGGEIPIYGDKHQDVPAEQQNFLFGFCLFAVNETAQAFPTEPGQDTESTSDTGAPTIPVSTPASSTSSSFAPTTSPSTTTAGQSGSTEAPTSSGTVTNPPSQDASTPLVETTLSPSAANPSEGGPGTSTTTISPSTNSNDNSDGTGTTLAPAVPTTTTFSPTITLPPSAAAPTAAPVGPSSGFQPESAPTNAPTTVAEAGSPSSFAAFATVRPLNPVQQMKYSLKFYINYGGFVDREPTQEEYEGLRVALEAFFFKLIDREYEDSPETDLISHDLSIEEAKYIPNPTEDRYSHSLQFASNFTFSGVDPPINDLFNVFDNMSMQELTEQAVFAAKPRFGIFFYTAGILWTNGVSTASTRSDTSRGYNIKRSGVYSEATPQVPPG